MTSRLVDTPSEHSIGLTHHQLKPRSSNDGAIGWTESWREVGPALLRPQIAMPEPESQMPVFTLIVALGSASTLRFKTAELMLLDVRLLT